MKRNTLKIGLLVCSMGLFTANDIFAQEQDQKKEKGKQPTVEEIFKMMDANEDGKLSKKEVKGPLKNNFDKIDANEDGFITKKELEKAPKRDGKRPPKRNN